MSIVSTPVLFALKVRRPCSATSSLIYLLSTWNYKARPRRLTSLELPSPIAQCKAVDARTGSIAFVAVALKVFHLLVPVCRAHSFDKQFRMPCTPGPGKRNSLHTSVPFTSRFRIFCCICEVGIEPVMYVWIQFNIVLTSTVGRIQSETTLNTVVDIM